MPRFMKRKVSWSSGMSLLVRLRAKGCSLSVNESSGLRIMMGIFCEMLFVGSSSDFLYPSSLSDSRSSDSSSSESFLGALSFWRFGDKFELVQSRCACCDAHA